MLLYHWTATQGEENLRGGRKRRPFEERNRMIIWGGRWSLTSARELYYSLYI